MKPTFKEAEKALKFIADMGLNAGAYAHQEIGRISEWQQLNMSAIRSLSDSLKTTTGKVAREVLANELKLRTLVYRHEYKKKMRHRRVMKLVKNMYSWFHCAKTLKTGVPEMNKNGEFSLKQVSLFGPARSYAELTGKTLAVVKGKARPGDFAFVQRKKKGEADEAYVLTIKQSAQVEAHSLRGLQWAASTLLQMTRQNASLPQGVAQDAPAYEMRGFMIDCGRKFFPMSYLRNLVKTLGYYKMNTLQVHLNDNGFRQ